MDENARKAVEMWLAGADWYQTPVPEYLESYSDPTAIEFYLYGPAMRINACNKMLAGLGIPDERIAYDEF